jgi:hypothetical protein
LAQELLNPHASHEADALLGYDLGTAAKWLDCARSVVRNSDGAFAYVADPRFKRACEAFDAAETARMEDYARRNWDNCRPPDAPAEARLEACASEYHYADVAISRDGYGPTYGTSDRDVVHALAAALAVLRGGPAPPPFSFVDKREALLVLLHLAGDIHEPLHVGAIYLTPDGTPLDPDSVPADVAKAGSTRGGNWIAFGPRGQQNLHAEWDNIPASWNAAKLNDKKRAAWLAALTAIARTEGNIDNWPQITATETVLVSRRAFDGLTFAPDPDTKHWRALAADPRAYAKDRRDLQHLQIARAAARLAAMLNTLWPDE